tara:strand:- start:1169 stop:1588 length:420 start_codon:yes stop_codon:yes gene_type:complete
MWRWLSNLRQQPKAYRQRVAFVGAVSMTAVIALMWSVSLPQRLSTIGNVVEEPNEETQSSFNRFFADVREQVAVVGDSVATLRQGADSQPATTSPPTASSTTSTASTTPNIVIPQLTPEEARRLNPQPVLIATTSATTS